MRAILTALCLSVTASTAADVRVALIGTTGEAHVVSAADLAQIPLAAYTHAWVWDDARPPAKNQSRSRMMGPPSVYSYVGTVLSIFGSPNGVIVLQLSLVNVVRKEPLNVLPPDLVSVLTTPPPKPPYSEEIPDVEMVVS